MKTKNWIGANIILLGFIAFLAINPNTSAENKNIWEYKTRDGTLRNISHTKTGVRNLIDPEGELNKFGEEGWELVAIEPLDEYNKGPMYIFKRKKQ